jgi:hypothetical protein
MLAPDHYPDPGMRKSRNPGSHAGRDPGEESKTTAVPQRRLLRPRQLDAGVFGAEVASFRLHLAAENKAERTIRVYTEAVRWFAAAHLRCQTSKTRWGQVDGQDIRR